MKIAITATDNDLSAKMDKRFGRCSYFAVVDEENKKTEFLRNPNSEANEGAGPASVQFISELGVRKVISGDFGAKATDLMNELGVERVCLNNDVKSIAEIIISLKNGTLG